MVADSLSHAQTEAHLVVNEPEMKLDQSIAEVPSQAPDTPKTMADHQDESDADSNGKLHGEPMASGLLTPPTSEPETHPIPSITRWDALLTQPGGMPDILAVKEDPMLSYFANDTFEVRVSPLGGLGVFAAKALKYLDIVLVEEPLVRLSFDFSDLVQKYTAMDEGRRAIFNKLHVHTNESIPTRLEGVASANSFLVPSKPRASLAIFALGSRINHQCDGKRNLTYSWTDDRSNIIFWVSCKTGVDAGQELFIDYGGSRESLFIRYGFQCSCGGCRAPQPWENIPVDYSVCAEEIRKKQVGLNRPDVRPSW